MEIKVVILLLWMIFTLSIEATGNGGSQGGTGGGPRPREDQEFSIIPEVPIEGAMSITLNLQEGIFIEDLETNLVSDENWIKIGDLDGLEALEESDLSVLDAVEYYDEIIRINDNDEVEIKEEFLTN